MPTSMSPGAVALTLAIWIAVAVLPGLLVGLAAGLRGWLLAGTAPLVTYAIAGLAGPWLEVAGTGYNGVRFVGAVVLVSAIAFGTRLFRRPGVRTAANPWQRQAHLAVLVCVGIAAVVGAYAVLRGMGRLDAIAQDWDAAFHANGIRYITETGDGGLTGMSGINKYGDGTPLFYPNAYHLVGTVVYQLVLPLAGAPLPAILNGNTVLFPGLLALSLATLVRAFRGRAVLAGATALVSIAPVTLLYESLNRGPLLPFLLGVALLPAGVAALRAFLDRTDSATGLVLVLCAAGLLTIHPSVPIALLFFAVPMLVQRWAARDVPGGRARTIRTEFTFLLAAAVATAAITAPQLAGAYHRPAVNGPQIWPAEHDVPGALRALVMFEHDQPTPQLWLFAAGVLGVVFLARLDGLRWITATVVLTGGAWVAVATSESDTVIELSQPLWNDPWRFMTLAALPLTVVAANGLAGTQAFLRDRLLALRPVAVRFGYAPVAAAVAAVVLAGFAVASNGLYAPSNAAAVSRYHRSEDLMAERTGYVSTAKANTSADEARAMLELGRIADDGDWAMNDRFDGSVWTYAISGVRTVAAHHDEVEVPSDARLLAERFRDYPTDPAVRAAVDRWDVRWVIVGKSGFIRDKPRTPGLVGYDDLPFLTRVYENPGAAIYRVEPAP